MSKGLQKDKYLIISPHQDDFVIGCGGFLWQKKREKTAVLYFYEIDNEEEVLSSEKILNINKRWFLNQEARAIRPSNCVDDIIKVIRGFRPTHLFVINKDTDRDHDFCSEICLEAFFLSGVPYKLNLGGTWDKTSVFGYSVWTEIKNPSILLDISDCFKYKLMAINKHKSQLNHFPYKQFIESRGKIYGLLNNSDYAEAFSVIKLNRI